MNTSVPVGQLVQASATIAISGQLSSEISTEGSSLCGIMLPAAFTGVALTFYASSTSGGTYQQMFNSAGAISYTVAQGEYIAIDPKDFAGVFFLKIKSGSAEAAARTIVCSMKGI